MFGYTIKEQHLFYSTDGKFCSVVFRSYVSIRCLPYFTHIISFHCLLSWTSTSHSRVHLHTSPSLPEMAHTFLNLLSIEAMHNPERSVQWLTPELAWTAMWYNTCLHSKRQFLLLVINVFGTVSFYLFMSMSRMSFPLPSSQISLVYHSVLKYKVSSFLNLL